MRNNLPITLFVYTLDIKKNKSASKKFFSVFGSSYLAYQYHVVKFLTEHLADAEKPFGGDLQQMLLIAAIGQTELKARLLQPQANTARDAGVHQRFASR